MGNTTSSFKKEFGLIMVGALIFTASFLWKDLIKDYEDAFLPKKYSLLWRSIYTILITVVLVLLAIHMRGLFGLSNSPTSIQFDDGPIDNQENNVDVSGDISGNIDVHDE